MPPKKAAVKSCDRHSWLNHTAFPDTTSAAQFFAAATTRGVASCGGHQRELPADLPKYQLPPPLSAFIQEAAPMTTVTRKSSDGKSTKRRKSSVAAATTRKTTTSSSAGNPSKSEQRAVMVEVATCTLKTVKVAMVTIGGVYMPPDCCGFVAHVKWGRGVSPAKVRGWCIASERVKAPYMTISTDGAGCICESIFTPIGHRNVDGSAFGLSLPSDGSASSSWAVGSLSAFQSRKIHDTCRNIFVPAKTLSKAERIATEPPAKGQPKLPLNSLPLAITVVPGEDCLDIEQFTIAFVRRDRSPTLQRCVLSLRKARNYGFPLRDPSTVPPALQIGSSTDPHDGVPLMMAVAELPVELIVLVYSFLHPWQQQHISSFYDLVQRAAATSTSTATTATPPPPIPSRTRLLCDPESIMDGRYANVAVTVKY